MNKMKFYPMNSIDKKYCKFSDPRLFELLETCILCNKIPLPTYKSVQIQKNSYCLDCYNQENFDAKNLIEPSKALEFLLEKLVMNCKYEEKGCKERYEINSLQNLLDHEKVCFYNPSTKLLLKQNSIYINEALENCLRCYDLNVDVTNHDCITTLLKIVLELSSQIKTLTSKNEQQNIEKEQIDDKSQEPVEQLDDNFENEKTKNGNKETVKEDIKQEKPTSNASQDSQTGLFLQNNEFHNYFYS